MLKAVFGFSPILDPSHKVHHMLKRVARPPLGSGWRVDSSPDKGMRSEFEGGFSMRSSSH